MFRKSVVMGTITMGVASALIAGVIVSIGDVQASPAEATRPAVPVAIGLETTDVTTPTERSSAPAGLASDRGPDHAESSLVPLRAGSRPRPLDREGTPPPPADDAFAPLTSPDIGDHCAAGLDAQDVSEFFSLPIGDFQGADYQRALRLPDDRVLWTFQDAFIGGTLVHNTAMVQSGRCFTLLDDGARSWLLAEQTSHMQQWQWILGGGIGTDGTQIHLFVAQMDETGDTYLSRTRPTALRRVVLDARTLDTVEVIDESTRDDLYGWSVTNDATHTYLFSHCYQQFGYDTILGFGECVGDVKLARVPLGRFDAEREYWDGSSWSADSGLAAPVVSPAFVGSGNNPAQISYDGTRFILVQKRDDWWGTTIDFGVATDPQGPFVPTESVDEPRGCEGCNTYFATWVPWNDSSGSHIWSIGHNRWNGSETASHLADYPPTFHTIDL